jgi:carboxylesterase
MHCPLLPGHGHWPDKLKGFTRQDWIAAAIEGLAHIRTLCDETFLMGHSMGTVLCAHLALQNADIRGLVMLTPLYDSPDNRLATLKLARPFMTWFYPARLPSKSLQRLVRERVQDFYPDLNLDDPEVKKRIPEMTRLPVASVIEMLKMAEYGRTLFSQLTTPSLIFHGGHDPAVKPGSVERLFEVLPGPDKKIKFFPESGHELMRPFDPVHEIVWKMVFDFVYERSALRQPAA